MQKQLDNNIEHWAFKSDLGYLHLGSKDSSLVSLEIRDYDLPNSDRAKTAFQKEVDSQLQAYFEGKLSNFTLALATEGRDFEQKVWHALTKIEYGTTCYYSQLATKLGDKNKARAVGKACGSNKIAIIIPCHRVVAVGGALGGYAYGVLVKRALLDLEHKFAQNKQ